MPKVNDDYPKKQEQMSDADLKRMAVQQFEKNPIKANNDKSEGYKFPTEIVELPSKGLLYPEDNPLSSGKVEMKYMTAKEEDIITTPSLIKQGVVLDRLFQALIVGNGEGQKIKYGDLLHGDKNAIMIAARVLGYGKDYQVTLKTPSGDEMKEIIDLTKIEDKPLNMDELTPGKNEFSIKLPVSKRTLVFKLLTHRDEHAIERDLKAQRKYNKMKGNNSTVTTRLSHMIVSVDGNDDREFIKNFVTNEFLARDVQTMREKIQTVSPDVDLEFTFIDEETGEDFEATLPIGLDFFWPSADV